MVDSLIVSNLLLWVLVLALGGVVLALMRQIGVLQERVAPAGALMVSSGLEPGKPAPELQALDWAGSASKVGGVSLDGRSTLLIFLSPSCPVCKTLLATIESIRGQEAGWLRVVLASDGPREEHEAFVREHRLDRGAYLLSTELGLAYRVSRLPYSVLIDERGTVRAAGLVNSREHLESLFEAKRLGAASLQAYLGREGARHVA